MKVESIAECSPWSILQYFWPALSNSRSWKPILVFFSSGHLRQVLLYKHKKGASNIDISLLMRKRKTNMHLLMINDIFKLDATEWGLSNTTLPLVN